MVKKVKNMKFINLKNINELGDDTYLFVEYRLDYDLNYRIINRNMYVGIFNNTFYVFDHNAELRLRLDIDKIENIFSFEIYEEVDLP